MAIPFLRFCLVHSVSSLSVLYMNCLIIECERRNVLGSEGQKWKDNVYNPYTKGSYSLWGMGVDRGLEGTSEGVGPPKGSGEVASPRGTGCLEGLAVRSPSGWGKSVLALPHD